MASDIVSLTPRWLKLHDLYIIEDNSSQKYRQADFLRQQCEQFSLYEIEFHISSPNHLYT